MGVKIALETLRQAENLKQQITNFEPKDFASPNSIALQKELQHLYRHIFVVDIKFGLEHKIDQDLWNIGFKLGISSLQELMKSKQYTQSQKSEYSALLCWYLSGASGFFISLLNSTWGVRKDLSETKMETSYLAQYCLVHLGDLSRYQAHKDEAQNYYEHAIKLTPDFGHAYNQLALLEPKATPMDALKICSFYCRAAYAPQSFGPAHNNLLRLLEEYKNFEFSILVTVDDYVRAVLKQIYNILNHSTYDMNIDYKGAILLDETKLVEILILLTYTHFRKTETTDKDADLSKDEIISQRIILKLVLHLLSTVNSSNISQKSSYLILSWIAKNKQIMEDITLWRQYSHLQKTFEILLNNLSETDIDDDGGIVKDESDFVMYLPFDISSNANVISEDTEMIIRNHRIINWLKLILNVIKRSSDSDIQKVEEDVKIMDRNFEITISRSLSSEISKSKPKPKTRTNVAIQAILQMQQKSKMDNEANRSENTITSSSLTPSNQFEQKSDKPDFESRTTTEENIINEAAIRSLHSLPIDSSHHAPTFDWMDDGETKNHEGSETQDESLYTNINFLENTRKSAKASSVIGVDGAVSDLWGQGASYSLFSGHSPLAKLLEDQKTSRDSNVIK